MNLDRSDPSAPIRFLCYATGGASIESEDGYTWCGSNKYQGWHPTAEASEHARYFVTVKAALQFAQGMGWVGE